MVEKEKKSIGKLIRTFLLVIFTGVIVALIAAGGTLYYLSPTGSYQVVNILLSPDLVENLSYPEVDPKTGQPVRYAFQQIEFLYFGKKDEQWHTIKTNEEGYRKFFNLVSDEGSILVVPNNIRDLFQSENPASLTIVVEKAVTENEKEETKAFQEVQFVSNYFRIRLHDDNEQQANWAYYYHPKINQEVENIFIPKK